MDRPLCSDTENPHCTALKSKREELQHLLEKGKDGTAYDKAYSEYNEIAKLYDKWADENGRTALKKIMDTHGITDDDIQQKKKPRSPKPRRCKQQKTNDGGSKATALILDDENEEDEEDEDYIESEEDEEEEDEECDEEEENDDSEDEENEEKDTDKMTDL